MANHFLFLGNVAAHLVALMSGLASFAIATWEAYKKRPISQKVFWLIGAICLCVAFDSAWQDEHKNAQTVALEKASEAGLKNMCFQDKRVEDAYSKGLEGMNSGQRQTIDKQQQSIDSQQKDVSSCVVSLGKMNPKVRESIAVVPISLFTMEPATGKLVGIFAAHKVYVTELIITTNEIEPRFHGNLSCENPFTAISAPRLPSSSQTVMTTTPLPNRISDREYEISTTASGTEWGPTYPAYMRITTELESPGKCTFTPL